MDFARLQLEKYGWKDGEGLGKKKSGISKPLKPSLKFDNSGLGHKISDELINPWWQRVYDTAAKSVNVENNSDSVLVKSNGSEDFEITTKRKKVKRSKCDDGTYSNFVKRGALTNHGEEKIGSEVEDSDEESQPKKRTSGILDLTDEELFKACGGRTAHKGARHGLSMSAKLARLESHEEVGTLTKKKKKKKSKTSK